MNLIKYFFLLIFISTSILAQTKNIEIEELFTNSKQYYPEKLEQLQWIPDQNAVSYLISGEDQKFLVKKKVNSKKEKELLSFENLKNKHFTLTKRELSYFPSIKWKNDKAFYYWNNDSLFIYNLVNNNIELVNSIEKKSSNVEPGDNNLLAYTIDNNLFISKDVNTKLQITYDNNKDILNGSSNVHRNEFGISKGIFWSPKSNFIAFYRMDQTMVTDYPMFDLSEKPAQVINIKYPMAGMKSHEVNVGVFNLNTEKIVWLETGEPKDQYLTNVSWSPDEKYLFVVHLNRDQNHMQFIKYDALTGKRLKILFEEKDNEYVEPEHPALFIDNERFLWFSERDGFNHLYLYDTDGNLISQITKGNWEVTEFHGTDRNLRKAYITATKESPLERHLYSIDLKKLKIRKLTAENGTHNIIANRDCRYFIDNFSNLNTPNITTVLSDKGEVKNNLMNSNNPFDNFPAGKIEIVEIQNKDNIRLYGRIIYPADFNENKKYPVMLYVYGGPHSQQVSDRWLGGSNMFLNYMAQQGFIVFTLDNRGTPYRGLDFEQETFRQLGTKEISDQVEGMKYLTSLPFVDSTNMGVFGWSYGGFMATSLMTRTPDLFKIGVAGGAVIDWKYYEAMYTERYMDSPDQNPEGYKNANLLNYVDNLKGKLLLVHGTSDPTVVWQHSLLFSERAANLNIPLDYYPYIGHGHGVRGFDAIHLYNKIANYFIDYLNNDKKLDI